MVLSANKVHIHLAWSKQKRSTSRPSRLFYPFSLPTWAKRCITEYWEPWPPANIVLLRSEIVWEEKKGSSTTATTIMFRTSKTGVLALRVCIVSLLRVSHTFTLLCHCIWNLTALNFSFYLINRVLCYSSIASFIHSASCVNDRIEQRYLGSVVNVVHERPNWINISRFGRYNEATITTWACPASFAPDIGPRPLSGSHRHMYAVTGNAK